MGWLALSGGILLWWGAHLFKRVAPERRAAMGDAGKGVVAALLAVAVLLVVLGYRSVDFIPVWTPPAFMVHLNNLLVLIAIFMMSPASKRGRLMNKLRHPMLIGFSLWATAHLLVNGDVASILLFAGMLVWALVEMRVINATDPDWSAPPPGSFAKDGMFLAASVVLMGVIGMIHGWLGPSPFPS